MSPTRQSCTFRAVSHIAAERVSAAGRRARGTVARGIWRCHACGQVSTVGRRPKLTPTCNGIRGSRWCCDHHDRGCRPRHRVRARYRLVPRPPTRRATVPPELDALREQLNRDAEGEPMSPNGMPGSSNGSTPADAASSTLYRPRRRPRRKRKEREVAAMYAAGPVRRQGTEDYAVQAVLDDTSVTSTRSVGTASADRNDDGGRGHPIARPIQYDQRSAVTHAVAQVWRRGLRWRNARSVATWWLSRLVDDPSGTARCSAEGWRSTSCAGECGGWSAVDVDVERLEQVLRGGCVYNEAARREELAAARAFRDECRKELEVVALWSERGLLTTGGTEDG